MYSISSSHGPTRIAASPAATSTSTLKFQTFRLGNDEYGIDARTIRELRSYEDVPRIADAPEYIKGVANLHGAIVPIIDLRIKLGRGRPSYDPHTAVIVLTIADRSIGMVVDSISRAIALETDQIMPVVEMNSAFDIHYLIGVYASMERMVTLVDIDRWMHHYETRLIEKYAA